MSPMDYNPHSVHEILLRIRDQMRCPQCGTRVIVDFPSIKLAGEDFILLQLKCSSCNAFIVLHVNLSHSHSPQHAPSAEKNVSSTLSLDEEEMTMLQHALRDSGGSFEMLFKTTQEGAKE